MLIVLEFTTHEAVEHSLQLGYYLIYMSNQPSVEPDCPFCRTNGLLKGAVTAETDTAYLIEATFGSGNFLVIPTAHIESPLGLPDTWWKDVKTLLPKIPNLTSDYNLSFNLGKEAGQSLKHVHLWVISRIAGQPASGKGLARLIDEANAQAV